MTAPPSCCDENPADQIDGADHAGAAREPPEQVDGAGEARALTVNLGDLTDEAQGAGRKQQSVEQRGRANRVDRKSLGRGAADRGLGEPIGRREDKAGEQLERILPAVVRFANGAIAGDRVAQERIGRQDRRGGIDLRLQLVRQSERDQASEALGGAQPPQPAQFRHKPVGCAAGPSRHCRRRGDAEPRAVRKGAVDELDEIDANQADDEDAEAGRGDANGRPGPPGSPGRKVRLGRQLQVQLQPPGFVAFENARPQPLARSARFRRSSEPLSARWGEREGPGA